MNNAGVKLPWSCASGHPIYAYHTGQSACHILEMEETSFLMWAFSGYRKGGKAGDYK